MRGFALLKMNEFTLCQRPADALRTRAVVFTPLGTARFAVRTANALRTREIVVTPLGLLGIVTAQINKKSRSFGSCFFHISSFT